MNYINQATKQSVTSGNLPVPRADVLWSWIFQVDTSQSRNWNEKHICVCVCVCVVCVCACVHVCVCVSVIHVERIDDYVNRMCSYSSGKAIKDQRSKVTEPVFGLKPTLFRKGVSLVLHSSYLQTKSEVWLYTTTKAWMGTCMYKWVYLCLIH